MQITQLLELANCDFTVCPLGLTSYGSVSYFELVNKNGEAMASFLANVHYGHVYEVHIQFGKIDYRWIDPLYRKSVSISAKHIDLEVEEDVLEKLDGVINKKDFDKRIIIPLYLTNEEELLLHRAAHELKQSTNDFVNHAFNLELKKPIISAYSI